MSLQVIACIVALVLAIGAALYVAYQVKTAERVSSPRPFSEKRLYLRTRVNCRGFLTSTAKPGRAIAVRCADISQYGARVVSSTPLDPGTAIVLVIPSLRLTGIGVVRHSKKRRLRHVMGLEFQAPLQRTEIGDWIIQSTQPKSA